MTTEAATEPRPRLHQRKLIAIAVTLTLGVVYFVAPSIYSPPKDSILNWFLTASLMNALFLSFITVNVYNISTMLLEYIVWTRQDGQRFDGFWGDGAYERCADGVILVQSDLISEIVSPEQDKLSFASSMLVWRMYKARQWINACDSMAAQALVTAFQKLLFNAPKLEFVARDREENSRHENAPFTISLGLGYSSETISLLDKCSGWLRVDPDCEHGDTVALAKHLIEGDISRGFLKARDVKAMPGEPEGYLFERFIPVTWDRERWLKPESGSQRWLKSESGSDPVKNDYAIILRHTEFVGSPKRRQIQFVVAGFTERGTEAAGKYLADNWEKLWKDYVRKNWRNEADCGDFLLFIHGPSDVNGVDQEHWGPHPIVAHVARPSAVSKVTQAGKSAWAVRKKSS